MSAEGFQNRIRADQRINEPVARGELPLERDGLDNLGLRLFAEPLQGGDLMSLTCCLELLHRIDAQLLVQPLHLLGAQALDLQQGRQARGKRRLQFVVVGQGAGGHQAGDFFLERLPETLEFPQAILSHDFLQWLRQPLQNAGSILVGSGFERVFALQFQQRPDLQKHRGHLILVHAHARA